MGCTRQKWHVMPTSYRHVTRKFLRLRSSYLSTSAEAFVTANGWHEAKMSWKQLPKPEADITAAVKMCKGLGH